MKIKPTIVFSIVFFIVAFSLFILFYQSHVRAKAMVQINDHADIIASSLWTFEKSSPTVYLTLAAKANGYERIVVKDDKGMIFLEINGPRLSKTETVLLSLKMIPVYPLESMIKFEGKKIGSITASWPCRAIYTYLYVLLCILLALPGIWFFLKLLDSKRTLESRVRQRTAELEKENSERRSVEEALKESERQFRDIAELSPQIIYEMDTEGHLTFLNKEAMRIFDITKEDLQKRIEVFVLFPPEAHTRVRHNLKRIVEKGSSRGNEYLMLHKNGLTFPVMAYSAPIIREGQLAGFRGVITDITELKRAEEALGESERKYRSVIENIQDVFYRSDTKGRLIMGSPSGARMFGYDSVDDMIGQPLEVFWPDPTRRQQLLAEIRGKGYVKDFEAVLKKKDGSTFNASFTTHFYYNDQGNFLGTEGIIRDVTDRKRAEEETQRLRNYLVNIIDSMPSMLVGVDKEGKITQWNQSAERMTGLKAKEAQGQPLEKVLPMLSQEMGRVHQAIRDRTVQLDTKVPCVVRGEVRYEDVTVYPLVTNGVEGAVIRVDDVTERTRIEEMMIQSEKMLSVGGLAAGMAHEINNPLGVILQASQNVLRRVSPELEANIRVAEACGTTLSVIRQYLERREVPVFLEDIRQSGQRAAEIVENMLSFSRKPEAGGSSTDLAELLDRTVALAGSDYNLKKQHDFRQIEIVREYHPDVPWVVCQPSKIQQVFLNILRNGAEAMQETKVSGRAPRFVLRLMREGGRVRVEIEDNGPGMAETIRRRVFEPFFTTKTPGVGTGLGLSVSYFIITEDHGGTISVESAPGEGTQFIIRLPVEGKRS